MDHKIVTLEEELKLETTFGGSFSQYWVRKIQFPIFGSLVETRLLV
jgi:hypothetical protein